MKHALTVILASVIGLQPVPLLADGGTLRLSQRLGERQVSVFTSPSVLRVGLIDISVLVQDAASGNVQENLQVKVQLECLDQSAIPLVQEATSAAATNKLFQAAAFDVPHAGLWRATVSVVDGPPAVVRFDLKIGPPLPPWIDLAPWVAWPLAVVALFLIHQRLVVRHALKRRPPGFPAHSLQTGPLPVSSRSANA